METIEGLKMVAAACVLIAGLATPTPARIIYVDDDAVGAADGTSWSDAFPFLLDALAVAGPGDEIRVAQGTYRPNQGITAKPYQPGGRAPERGLQYPPFRLRSGLTLRGGFAGLDANDPDARDVKRFETILSGDLNGNDAAGWLPADPVYESTRTDNNANVVDCENGVLDGFVVQSATERGLTSSGSPRVTNCTFRWNSGGGFYCSGGYLEDCLFRENSGISGGGLVVVGLGSRTNIVLAHLTVVECRFVNNSAAGTGGAIGASGSRLSLRGCSFEGNTAGAGGAILHSGGSLALSDCRFEDNWARDRGGAVTLLSLQMATMTHCLFRDNRAIWGGALSNQEGPLTLDSDVFSGNQAQFGGVIAAVAGWSTLAPGVNDILMRGCLLTGNRGLESGGTLYGGPRATFTVANCTFADNWTRTAGLPASMAFQITLEDCILWEGGESIAPSLPRFGAVTIRYSDVRGGWPGKGNIDADPMFSGPGRWEDSSHPGVVVKSDDPDAVWVEGDYHLKSQAGRWDPANEDWTLDDVTSPCIDAGDPESPFADEPQPNGGRVNMGAHGGTAEASKSLMR
jgi:hypothetical protein